MESHLSFSTVTATIFPVIVLVFLLHILNRNRANRGKNRKPPQAKGAWPIIGHLHLLGGPQLPHHVLGDMADKNGPIFTIKLGVHQALVVSDGAIAKDCFTTNDKAFASRPKSEATQLMAYNYAMFAFAPYGEYWRQMRKMVMLEVLSQRRVEMFGHIRTSELRASIRDLYRHWVENESEKPEMVKVEISQWFGNLVVNIMVRIITGKSFSPSDAEGVRFQMVVKKFFELMGAFVVSDYIPYVKCLDVGGYSEAMKKTARDLDIIFEGWLNERRIGSKSSQQHEGNRVIIDVLISLLQGASEEEFPGFDHDTVIKSTCQQFVLKTPSDEAIDMSETSGLTISKTTPLEVLLTPRLSSNMY
ncbi:hypothetical protein L1887_11539 [Cichorium endivia]|nr:hypothetical protein L1887_11539 [Cichorium endivia]